MQTSDSIAQIAAALSVAQADITSPPRNREVTVKTKGGGTYKFKYATLDTIIDHVREPLTKNGLWFVQTLANGDGKYRLETSLIHSSGEWLRSETPLLVNENGSQAFGSALTYMKRYALCAMLGVAADEDDDGNAADGKEATIQERPERPRAPRKQDAPTVELPKEPGLIRVPNIEDPKVRWEAWGKAMSAAIDGAESIDELDRWMNANDPALRNMGQDVKAWADRLIDRATDRRDHLAPNMMAAG